MTTVAPLVVSRVAFFACLAACRAAPDPPRPAPDPTASALPSAASTPPPGSATATIVDTRFLGARAVRVEGGDVIAELATGDVHVTAFGDVIAATLSADQKQIAFIRRRPTSGCTLPYAEGGSQCDDLWYVRTAETPRLIQASKSSGQHDGNYANVGGPRFTADSAALLYETNPSPGSPHGSETHVRELASGHEVILPMYVEHEIVTGPFRGQFVLFGTHIVWDPITKASLGRQSFYRLASRTGVLGVTLPVDDAKRKAFLKE